MVLCMEILIFSDSHGNVSRMRKVIAEHPNAKHILFCGDGLKDIASLEAEFPKRIFLSVKGNCDGWFSTLEEPDERVFPLGGLRFLMMHGHTYGVKGSYGVAAAQAAKLEADILLFGHTHIPFDGYLAVGDQRIHMFNPGSIGARDGDASYGVLTIQENGYLFSHGYFKDRKGKLT